jgi:hypothetical protein
MNSVEMITYYKTMRELYTYTIIHQRLMTYQADEFKELLDEYISALESSSESHYDITTFMSEERILLLRNYADIIKGNIEQQ